MTPTLKGFRPWAWLALLTLCSACIAYWRSFSRMVPYDDEGTMMLGLDRFFKGQPLYDSVRSIYGPFYYLYETVAHRLANSPVSHDVVRWASVLWWVAAAVLLFVAVYRATNSLVLAAIAQYIGFRSMGFIGLETAHPQEACITLLLALAVVAATRRPRTLHWLLFGVFTGLIALTKINLAIFVLTGLGLIFVFALPPGRVTTLVRIAASAGALALAPLLMAHTLNERWAERYAALVICSIAASLIAATSARIETTATWPDAAALLSGILIACLAVLAFPLSTGSTLHGMWFSLITFPSQHFAQTFSNPLQITALGLVWMAANLVLAATWRLRGLPDWFLLALRLAFVVLVLGCHFSYLPNELIVLGAPMLWLLLTSLTVSLLRAFLATVGVLQIMYAYPVAGAQTQFITVLLVIAAAVCIHDALPALAERIPAPRPAVAFAAAALVLVMYAHDLRSARARYASMEPLALPGAERLRIEPARAAILRRVVAAAHSCSLLVSEPGLYSLNLLARKPVPHLLVAGAWMLFNDDEAQRAIIGEIQRDPHPCAVVNEDVTRFWTGRDVSAQPLVRYLHQWPVTFTAGDYQFRLRP